ncbi:TonB-dependent receptor [Kordiimonas sediminis]|uniref:TonB-dependent receptor n=1 Tax=Kordiimonas sediminis TaxID=1735581 RepID=A0A919AKR1_9PROT|nr:TonB-dependent receptor [Kordiimonas sediminis]GHF14169.1 TonB-dependent receptor [Kordiimonas sediminis]
MRTLKYRGSTALVAGCLTLALSGQVIAQSDEEMTIEEVVVTGTYLKGKSQFDSPSPLTVIGAANLNEIGASNIADLVQTLTINNGAQNNPDAFTQNGTTGTSNFNLRGLGVASTLVLLNGRRQVVAGTITNDGIAFVDTSSLVPQIAIQRIEIVKDGAAAIYGTDAVAGVVNFITDDNFEGVELSGKWQALTDEGSQRDLQVEGKFGWGNDRTHVMGAVSYYDRTPLTTSERRLSRTQDDQSSLGNPGAFYLPALNEFLAANLGLGATPIIDPTGCDEHGGDSGGGGTVIAPGTALGVCRFDFGDYYNLVPEEDRLQGYLTLTQELGDGHELRLEGGYARNRATRNNSPTFPYLQLASSVVPAYHPEFPFLSNPFFDPTRPYAVFLGRAIGNGGDASPNQFASDTYRFSASMTGDVSENWSYDVAVTHAYNGYDLETRDVITQNFQNALFGYGGDNCNASLGVPGANGCEFFNPFATSYTTAPNSQSILDHVIGTQVINGTSKTTVVDAILSGTIGSTSSGDIGLAVGIQVRDELWGREYDDISNADGFAFIIGNDDFEDNRTAKAIFAETLIPVTEKFDLSLALRHEKYGGDIGSTTDPKISGLFRANDRTAIRLSYSTSFRAPSVFQVSGTSTSLNQVTDPLDGSTAFAAVRSFLPADGTREIKPEQGKAWNAGISWEPADGLQIDLDYWHYKFTDVIIGENYQAVVNADPMNTDRVIRAFGDTGSIVMVMVDFVNASSVKTEGFDISAKYSINTDMGVFQPFFEATHVLNYDIDDPQAGKIDGAGSRNFSNFGSPTPKWRMNGGLAFAGETTDARVYVRRISGMDDDQNPGTRIGSMTTVDARFSMNFGGFSESLDGTSLSLGVINAFDKKPPQVFTNGGFESKTHDPRGRMVYAKITTRF